MAARKGIRPRANEVQVRVRPRSPDQRLLQIDHETAGNADPEKQRRRADLAAGDQQEADQAGHKQKQIGIAEARDDLGEGLPDAVATRIKGVEHLMIERARAQPQHRAPDERERRQGERAAAQGARVADQFAPAPVPMIRLPSTVPS